VRIGGHSHSINDQTAALVLFLGAHAGVFAVTGPSPIFGAADQTSPHRVKVYVVDLLVYSLTVRRARSKNLGCHSSPSVPRRWLTALIELCFTDLKASEIVTGYTGAQMPCQWSGRKTQAVR